MLSASLYLNQKARYLYILWIWSETLCCLRFGNNDIMKLLTRSFSTENRIARKIIIRNLIINPEIILSVCTAILLNTPSELVIPLMSFPIPF